MARTERIELSLFGFVDRCVIQLHHVLTRRRAVDSNHNYSSICLANSADRLTGLLSMIGRSGRSRTCNARSGCLYRQLPTLIGEPTYVRFGSADGTCSSLPEGYPLVTRLKDVPLDHFASAPSFEISTMCKFEKLFFQPPGWRRLWESNPLRFAANDRM